MHRGAPAVGTHRFTSKIKRVRYRLDEECSCGRRPHASVAVCPEREGIEDPVVMMAPKNPVGNGSSGPAERHGQGIDRGLADHFRRPPGK